MKFILKYARVDNSDDSDDDKIILEEQVSDWQFIDDSTELDHQQPQDYYPLFKNATRNPEETIRDLSLAPPLDEFEESDPENYYYEQENKMSKDGINYDIFNNFEKSIEKF